ncbi:uncharacterized protein LOC127250937 [Andrographis paniculata]|uniref:uncharacterized protein LOC127250937 n=1 Tax=Andrographis paniculata TaxID=175694 RepID=UPI0021E6E2C5|nr:uncharacterized protein LOC127250937 [Andrographis paniculata]
MENAPNLPFKVGGLAEAKSFQQGFRGAWFRCKIKAIGEKKGSASCLLEYYDFPDEKQKWTKLYQMPPHTSRKAREKSRELILRPHYPAIYSEKQIPDVNMNSEVAVIVDNSWKVGDLVDWFTTGCYWSGTITKLLDDDKAVLMLHPPPFGEGLVYDIPLKDVRPSLEWSPKSGWTLPTQDTDPGRFCARLIKFRNHGTAELQTMDAETQAGTSVGPSLSSRASSNSLAVSDDLKSIGTADIQTQSAGPSVSKDTEDIEGNTKSPRGRESTGIADVNSRHAPAEVSEKNIQSSNPGATKEATRHLIHSDPFEASILDLQECLNKIKKLKKDLNGLSSSDTPSLQWKFVEPSSVSSKMSK